MNLSFGDQLYCSLLLERCECSLRQEIDWRKTKNILYREDEIRYFLNNMISALDFLQTKGMAHRNLSPLTIMIDFSKSFKLADIGYGKLNALHKRTELKELIYAAPEVIK